jgi:hypothetical protein
VRRTAVLALLAGCTASVSSGPGNGSGTTDQPGVTPTDLACDVLVVGGGLGGVAAAHEAASTGRRTCLTEETDWLGGQLSTQGVPVDQLCGDTARSYDQIFDEVLAWYRAHYPGAPTGAFNPGDCFRYTCAEPRVYADVIEHVFLAGLPDLVIVKQAHPVSAIVDGTTVRGVVFDRDGAPQLTIHAAITIDATETGDLLPLVGATYRTGREPMADTAEPSALADAGDVECTQRLEYTFALERRPPTEDHRIPMPPGYDPIKYGGVGFPISLDAPLTPGCQGSCPTWWTWRRYLAPTSLPGAANITSVNFVGDANDFAGNEAWCGPYGCNIIDKPATDRAAILEAAKQHALGYLYFLQHDASPPYPWLMLRPDVMGTSDGLAKTPYIRESRRIRALTTIREQDLGTTYSDTLGIGVYGTDLKTCASPHLDDSVAWGPAHYVEIPFGALVPETIDGLLAGAKDLGTTHISNGVYRVHPSEYNVGLAAGATAALAVETGQSPRQLRADEGMVRRLQQRILTGRGGPIAHLVDVPMTDPGFVAIQMAAASGVMGGYSDLTFHPDAALTRAEAALVTVRALRIPLVTDCRPVFSDVPCSHFAYGAIQALVDRGAIGGYADGTFQPNNPVTRAQMSKMFVVASCAIDPSSCVLPPPAPPYSDVTAGDWFYAYVARGRQRGWFAGDVTGALFQPGAQMTRRSAAFWTFNYLRARLALP